GQRNFHLEIKQLRIGYDGWAKDLVLTLAATDAFALNNLLSELSRLAFHTTYKADFLSLPVPPDFDLQLSDKMDVPIAPAELHDWLVRKGEKFIPFHGKGSPRTLTELFAKGSAGLFFSQEPGLVLWLMPKEADLSGQEVEIRQFALETDLVLGSVADLKSIAIVARERRTSPFALPPLRTESILAIAANETGEMAQSFERNTLFAGRYDERNDWAPIYLSDEIRHAELGSLLNITDQMLKSWSLNGTVDYQNFPYPKPHSYFAPVPLIEHLHLNSLTFNWNTKGSGYTTVWDGIALMNFSRTAALPVSYIPEGSGSITSDAAQVQEYEDIAFQWFASRNDPNLVRVANYSALHQIFHKFGIKASKMPPPPTYGAKGDQMLAEVAEGVFQKIRDADDAELQRVIEDAFKCATQGIRESFLRATMDTMRHYLRMEYPDLTPELEDMMLRLMTPALDSLVDENIAQYLLELKPEAFNQFAALRSDLRKLKTQAGASGLKIFSRMMVNMRTWQGIPPLPAMMALVNKYQENAEFQEYFSTLQSCLLRESGAPTTDELRQKYVLLEGADPQGWLKTPSIVVSWSVMSATAVGGHNLDAGVQTSFLIDNTLPPGKVKVIKKFSGEDVVMVNEQDIGKVTPELAKEAAHYTNDPVQLEILVSNHVKSMAAPEPPRPRTEVIEEEAETPQTTRGLQTSQIIGWNYGKEAADAHG
ncbi:MAG: hypothetical protein AAB316_22865, partial [Bacteroidota bacterium]